MLGHDAHRAAVAEMEAIQREVEALDGNAPAAVVEALEQRFAAARERVDAARRVASTAALRAQFLGDVEVSSTSTGGHAATFSSAPPSARSTGPAYSSSTGSGRITISSEPLTYERWRSDRSFFTDLMHYRLDGDLAAQERLQRHRREIDVLRRERPREVRVNLSSTDGQGGDFVPPLWMMEEWIPVVRAGRPFANAVTNRPLPQGTDTISIPRVLTGAATGAQQDLGAVLTTDPTTGALSVPVNTIAGQAVLSRQLFDRAQPGMDEVLFADLTADYNLRIDLQVLTGSGTGGNAKGVLSDTNRIQITYTDGTPTVGELYPKIADAFQRITAQRGFPPNLMVMHPRRWSWFSAALDAQSRPLIVPVSGNGSNAWGANTMGGEFDPNVAAVGMLFGLPVVIDANIPTSLGAGTNEDVIIVCRREDVWLLEDQPPKTRVDESVGSANLKVVVQFWNYYAATTERFSTAVATIGGSGLATPVF